MHLSFPANRRRRFSLLLAYINPAGGQHVGGKGNHGESGFLSPSRTLTVAVAHGYSYTIAQWWHDPMGGGSVENVRR